jgi:hypothetical protein
MQAASLVSQGLNSLLANIETWASELAKKMFRLTVIYEPEDFTYDLNVSGKHVALTRNDLAGDFGVRAVLKSKIKAERQAQAANTIQWFVPLMGSDAIVNKEAFAQTVIPTLADGFTRKTIASWFVPTEEQRLAQEAQLELQKQQAAALAQQNNSEIDLGYVDPTSGGRYGAADVARAISGPEIMDDYDPQSSPVGGNRKPSNTTRSLTYGNSTPLPEGQIAAAATPGTYPQANGQASGATAVEVPSYDDEDDTEQANAQTLQTLLSPTTGGQYANNAISGVNSPLTQGVVY